VDFVVAIAVDTKAGRQIVEVGQVVGGQCDVGGPSVLFEAFPSAGAGNRDDPGWGRDNLSASGQPAHPLCSIHE
jgi:hypothetical protein